MGELRMDVDKYLHNKYNQDAKLISPITIKGLSRGGLMRLFAKFGFKLGVEIGVQKGKFSQLMCQSIPDLRLIGVDPWEVYEEDPPSYFQGRYWADKCYSQAVDRYAKQPNASICRMKSMEAVQTIEKDSLDFVYIDGSHMFDFVMQDLIEWSKRVRPGGIVAGHDYYRHEYTNVIEAVDIYTRMHQINEWYLTDGRTPSFFWVRKWA